MTDTEIIPNERDKSNLELTMDEIVQQTYAAFLVSPDSALEILNDYYHTFEYIEPVERALTKAVYERGKLTRNIESLEKRYGEDHPGLDDKKELLGDLLKFTKGIKKILKGTYERPYDEEGIYKPAKLTLNRLDEENEESVDPSKETSVLKKPYS